MEYSRGNLEHEIETGREHSEYRLIKPEEIDEIEQKGQRKCLERLDII